MEVYLDAKTDSRETGYAYGHFADSIRKLSAEGFSVISLEEFARISAAAKNSEPFASIDGHWVADEFIYVPRKGTYLARPSKGINLSMIAARHSKGKEYFLKDTEIESALASSLRLNKLSVSIPSRRFGDDDLAVFIFGSSAAAQKYGDFLRDCYNVRKLKIHSLEKHAFAKQATPFARSCWFRTPPFTREFSILGDQKFSDNLRCSRGVRNRSDDALYYIHQPVVPGNESDDDEEEDEVAASRPRFDEDGEDDDEY